MVNSNTIHNINEFIRSGESNRFYQKVDVFLRPVEVLIKGKSQLRNIELFKTRQQ